MASADSGALSVLDLCTGNGALAVAAGRLGARDVTAVDLSRRAVAAAWLNARSRGLSVQVHCGDLLGPLAGRSFDLITANPPYVPSPLDRLPTRGVARCWDAGIDGRTVLDRICAATPEALNPGGVLLLVFSSLCGVELTLERLVDAGLEASVVQRSRQPFGPVLSARAAMLEDRGLIEAGQRWEELVVVRGHKPT
jgi:release factor glutamine methyltransferase